MQTVERKRTLGEGFGHLLNGKFRHESTLYYVCQTVWLIGYLPKFKVIL